MFRYISIFYIIILGFISICSAEYDLKFNPVTANDGLSQNTVNCILQDHEGYMWLGTQNGLNRYDGYEFNVYVNEQHNRNSLSDNFIRVLHEDRQGNLWIGTGSGGLNRLDPQRITITQYVPGPQDYTISGNSIWSIYEDSHGHIWVGTEQNGLNRLDTRTGEFYCYIPNASNAHSFSGFSAVSITEDSSGHLWIATENGLNELNLNHPASLDPYKASFVHYFHDARNKYSLSSNNLKKVLIDHKQQLWIGAWDGGINLYSPKTKRFNRYLNQPGIPSSLSDNDIVDMCEDHHGILWIATDGGGLNRFDPGTGKSVSFQYSPSQPHSVSHNRLRSVYVSAQEILWVGTEGTGFEMVNIRKNPFNSFLHQPGKAFSLSKNTIRSILEDHDKTLWIGTLGGGLNRLDRRSGTCMIYRNNPANPHSINNDDVTALFEDRYGRFWIGTWGGGLLSMDRQNGTFKAYMHDMFDSLSISDNRIQSISEDREGNLWIGTEHGLNRLNKDTFSFTRFYKNPDKPGTLSDNRVQAMFHDTDGMLWICTWDGLNRYDHGTGRFTAFYHNPADSLSICCNKIISIAQDKNGILWIGTFGGGIARYAPDHFPENHFQNFNVENGLPDNIVYGIIADTSGHIILSTNRGISVFDPVSNHFRNYKSEDGLMNEEFYWGAYTRDSRGYVYFGSVSGITYFHPDSLAYKSQDFPMVLTDIRIFDKSIKTHYTKLGFEKLILDHTENYLSFQFAALDYLNSDKNQYYYRMEGLDTDWIFAGQRRFISYTNLSPGNYSLRIRGKNSQGYISKNEAVVDFYITPPFWRTLWFLIMAFVLGFASLYGVYRARLHSIKKQRERLRLEVEERTRQLKSTNIELRKAKKETDDILQNVEEGFFLLNQELRIGSQYSKSLESMMEACDLSNKILIELFNEHTSEETIEGCRDYLNFMFDKEVDEDVLKDLNPISHVELNYNHNNTSTTKKVLSFKMKRVFNDAGDVVELFATVKDITEHIILTKKLEASEVEQKRQMELMFSILHVDPSLFSEFMSTVENELRQIELLINEPVSDKNLQTMYRAAHTIKGNASLLDLKHVVVSAHDFEDLLTEYEASRGASSRLTQSLKDHLSHLRKTIQELNSLISQIQNFQAYFRPKRRYENKLLIQSIENLVRTTASELQRDVYFDYQDFDPGSIPYNYQYLVKELLIQLIRNAVSHGIEPAEERRLNDKAEKGTISLSSLLTTNIFGFKIRDDGRGIQVDKLKNRAIKSGRWTEKAVQDMTDKEAVQLIFESGISTQEETNIIAGRGVGMDIIKNKLEQVNGTIDIAFEAGRYCEFTIKLPLLKEQ